MKFFIFVSVILGLADLTLARDPWSKPAKADKETMGNPITPNRLEKLVPKADLPAKEDLFSNNELYNMVDTQIQAYINGDDYHCEPGGIGYFVGDLLSSLSYWERDEFNYLYNDLSLSHWFMYAAFLSTESSLPEDFYPNAEQGNEYFSRTEDLEDFWDDHSDNISLFALSPRILRNGPLMLQVLDFVFGVPPEQGVIYVDYVLQMFDIYPFIGYMFPMWTLNAFASTWGAQNTIAMGDGMTQFFETVGLETVGPEYVLYHEFAHHVQFATNAGYRGSPERSRRTELMADFLAGYYATHYFGSLSVEETDRSENIIMASMAAYNAGECAFHSPGHHGTPNQRKRAILTAKEVIESESDRTEIIPARELIAKFDEIYEKKIVVPDAVPADVDP